MGIIVELSVENTNKYFNRFTLKGQYKGHSDGWAYIFPKNKDTLKYWKYRKCLKHIDGCITDEEVLFFTNEDQFINDIRDFYPCLNKYLVFEFPYDMEDEAFYFKMKYC